MKIKISIFDHLSVQVEESEDSNTNSNEEVAVVVSRRKTSLTNAVRY